MGDVRAQVAQRVGQPRAAVVAVLNGMAVLYLADDAPQRIALEHRFAMWVAGLAEPSGAVVLPRLPCAGRHHAYPTCAYDEQQFSMAERKEGGHTWLTLQV